MIEATPAPLRATVTPRQNRAMRTRDALLQAVETLTANEGAEAVTTTRIAALTGVAVGTIYRYFPNREALLLAAYDATVERIVAACGARLASLDPAMPAAKAIRTLLDVYLSAAEAIPAHPALLGEMRRLRPVAESHDSDIGLVEAQILRPLLARYGLHAAAARPGALAVVYTLVSNLVDLYLVTGDGVARANIRAELEAHALLAFERLKK